MITKKPVSKGLVIGIVAVVILVIAGIGFILAANRYDIGSTMTGNDGMTLLYVPAGEFTMGSSDLSDAQPHIVNLDAFWIDQTEVTNAMYAKCVEANQCNPHLTNGSNTHPNYFGHAEFDNYPVIYVDWNMAKTYCEWAGRRLPTEAEWEKAARGTDQRTWPWGNEPSDTLHNFDSIVGDTTEVGKYTNGSSPYGAYDMADNVWEWVNDWYSNTYYQNSPSSNPLGPDSGYLRVLRGGGGRGVLFYVPSSFRDRVGPTFTSFYLGFRCARSP
jgi:formylglycine-generating enzyme required for sulfatase activity